MTHAEFFSGQVVRTRNPLRLYGITRLIVGLAYVVTSALVLAAWVPELRTLITAPIQLLEESPAVILGTLRAIVAAGLLIVGVGILSRALNSATTLVVPPRAPRDLENQELVAALGKRELSAYAPQIGGSQRRLRRWLPHRFQLLTRGTRAVVAAGLGEIRRAFWILLAVVLAVVAFQILPPDALLVFGPYRASVPVLFLVTFLAGATLHVATVILTIPGATPRTDVEEFRASVRGGGDPVHLPHGLQHELDFLRPADGAPNRGAQIGLSMYEGGVTDAGQFEGQLLVENQPVIAEQAAPTSSRVLLFAGSFYEVAALYWFFRMPSLAALSVLPVSGGVMLAVYWVVQLGGAVLLNRLGSRMVSGAVAVLGTFRFRSTAVLLNVKGNYARSSLRIGKAIQDSIESDNLVVRCDFSVSGYAASLLTESPGLSGTRAVVGMIVDDTVRDVEHRVSGWLRDFEKQGATIAGIDLGDRALVEVMQANIGADLGRTAVQVRAAEMPATSIAAVPSQGLLAAAPADYPEMKICPDCAEPVRLAALKCRYCGYRFPIEGSALLKDAVAQERAPAAGPISPTPTP